MRALLARIWEVWAREKGWQVKAKDSGVLLQNATITQLLDYINAKLPEVAEFTLMQTPDSHWFATQVTKYRTITCSFACGPAQITTPLRIKTAFFFHGIRRL